MACLRSGLAMLRAWLQYILPMEPGENTHKTFKRARLRTGKPKLSFWKIVYIVAVRKRLFRIKKIVFNNMVQNYKQKTVKIYSEEMLIKAFNEVKAKKLSMRKASITYSVSKIFENYFTIVLHNKKYFIA